VQNLIEARRLSFKPPSTGTLKNNLRQTLADASRDHHSRTYSPPLYKPVSLTDASHACVSQAESPSQIDVTIPTRSHTQLGFTILSLSNSRKWKTQAGTCSCPSTTSARPSWPWAVRSTTCCSGSWSKWASISIATYRIASVHPPTQAWSWFKIFPAPPLSFTQSVSKVLLTSHALVDKLLELGFVKDATVLRCIHTDVSNLLHICLKYSTLTSPRCHTPQGLGRRLGSNVPPASDAGDQKPAPRPPACTDPPSDRPRNVCSPSVF